MGAVTPTETQAGAGTRKGRVRVRHILDTAVEVFLSQGYANFTVRAVADAAGMSLGNLNYYFPRKSALLKAMVEHVIDGYLAEFERLRRRTPDDPSLQLEHVVDFWLDDLGSARTTRFFPELWALANHDREAARLMNYVYERARGVLREVLAQMRPDLDAAALDHATVVMTATMEGLTLFAGHRKPWAADRAGLKAQVKAMFAALPAPAGLRGS
ncbi:MAG: TetR/AcrR family transcriptional regulator [Gammaproteobacteria bacterium]